MKTITLFGGLKTKVDDSDYEFLSKFKWYKQPQLHTHYVIGYVSGKMVRLHRFILNAPKDKTVDHIDGDGLNNQKSNLRLATVAQNRHNSKRTDKLNRTSRYKGVSYVAREKVYRSFTYIGRKQIYLGRFKSEIEAAKAYDNKVVELFGEFARINFPEAPYKWKKA